jgi:protein Mpv17
MNYLFRFLLVGFLCLKVSALTTRIMALSDSEPMLRQGKQVSKLTALQLRGGEVETLETVNDDKPSVLASAILPKLSVLTTAVVTLGQLYSQQLELRPIITKSWTAGLIFALSDYIAQRIEKSRGEKSFDQTRLIISALIGAIYFAPAAHYWYEAIFRLLPGTGMVSILKKAALGQAIFGPSFTCIFFAASLFQSGTFSLSRWGAKIRSDLPGAFLAGCGFWPFVDVISFSLVPIKLIPLFINMCSMVWTIYLSLISNQGSEKSA